MRDHLEIGKSCLSDFSVAWCGIWYQHDALFRGGGHLSLRSRISHRHHHSEKEKGNMFTWLSSSWAASWAAKRTLWAEQKHVASSVKTLCKNNYNFFYISKMQFFLQIHFTVIYFWTSSTISSRKFIHYSQFIQNISTIILFKLFQLQFTIYFTKYSTIYSKSSRFIFKE